jgi:hypothetical protein
MFSPTLSSGSGESTFRLLILLLVIPIPCFSVFGQSRLTYLLDEKLIVATTRPETMLGDTAIATMTLAIPIFITNTPYNLSSLTVVSSLYPTIAVHPSVAGACLSLRSTVYRTYLFPPKLNTGQIPRSPARTSISANTLIPTHRFIFSQPRIRHAAERNRPLSQRLLFRQPRHSVSRCLRRFYLAPCLRLREIGKGYENENTKGYDSRAGHSADRVPTSS